LFSKWDLTMDAERPKSQRQTKALVLHWACLYDVALSLVFHGRERAVRERMAGLARLAPGESVLDIGCGTGTLAISAKRVVGPEGRVAGIDASPQMIRRARRKAQKAGANVQFDNAIVEELPFPDQSFDAVLSTVMLHHLPEDARRECVREVRRVLKPGGRLLVVDFGGPRKERRSLVARLRRHIVFDLYEILPLFKDAGLRTVESGPLGVCDLQYVLAATPA
jgi:ubiquinone/menaquinone biosynthesis C-methylase UbiE